jgi:hypothetical protein
MNTTVAVCDKLGSDYATSLKGMTSPFFMPKLNEVSCASDLQWVLNFWRSN